MIRARKCASERTRNALCCALVGIPLLAWSHGEFYVPTIVLIPFVLFALHLSYIFHSALQEGQCMEGCT